MGYYSTFTIEADPDPGGLEGILIAVTGYHFEWYVRGYKTYDIKWYDSEKDMDHISRQFPETTFTVTREGEDHSDSRHALKNGEVVKQWEREWVEVD